jgi:uncharacterized membrane protein YjjP (DUF1212 family)
VIDDAKTEDLRDLQKFVVQLGAAMSASGETVDSVQQRLTRVAVAYGATKARISAFPTFMMVSMGSGEPATLEITSSLSATPRLDQISAVDQLVTEAEAGSVPPQDRLPRLAAVRSMPPRFGPAPSVAGYSIFSVGLCLILQPAPRDVAAAAIFGALVGVLHGLGRRQASLQLLMPVLAAFAVSSLDALAVRNDLLGPGLRAMVASLVVFLPGAALTTAVLELAAGQMVSGASRLVSGVIQLAFLSFGIVAGIEAVNVPAALVFEGSDEPLGAWAPWAGVLVFAVGVVFANSAPRRAFAGLVLVLYAAWVGQVVGNALLGGYVSAFVGALVMTPVAVWVSRLRSAMPPHASFLPGFWLLVPGALGLIGFTKLAGDMRPAAAQDLVNTVVSIFAVAVGVLCGTLVLAGATATRRVVDAVPAAVVERTPWLGVRRSVAATSSPTETSADSTPHEEGPTRRSRRRARTAGGDRARW